MIISVFVTYCWENEEHNGKVLSLTDDLRKRGFHAEMDKLKSQEETAIDFVKMMNEAMTSYDKVIVVLSKNYKSRAEMFKGGVGKEYQLIINDIEDNPSKYILVSFEGISKDITPLSFRGREIVDLQKGGIEFEKLWAKLMSAKTYKFSDVGSELPKIEQKDIPAISILSKNQGIIFKDINEDFITDSQQFGKYHSCRRRVSFNMVNKTDKTIEGCHIEIKINQKFLDNAYTGNGQKSGLSTIITSKIYPNQTIKTNPIDINITDYNCIEAGKGSIIGEIFSDAGQSSFEVPILNCISINHQSQKRRIELDDFLSN